MIPDESKHIDIELWNKFRAGNTLAFTQLMRKYSKTLSIYGFRICGDKDFTRDCIQEVFLALWTRKERINATSSVKGYLFKSVRLRIARDHQKWNRNEPLNDDYNFSVVFDIESRIIDEFDGEQQVNKIKQVINLLPSRQREIIYLRFYENLEFDQICKIMVISKQSVHNLLQKAYKNFRLEWWMIFILWFVEILFVINNIPIYQLIKN